MDLQTFIIHIGKISMIFGGIFHILIKNSGIEAELRKSETEASQKVKIHGIDTQGNVVLQGSDGNSITINPNLYSYDNIHKIVHPKV